MLKIIRETAERLLETSPTVPPHIIEEYKKIFKEKQDICHPEMTTGIIKLDINREEKSKNIITISAGNGQKRQGLSV
jgi:hypothetical protein